MVTKKKVDVFLDAEADDLLPFAKNVWVVVVKIMGLPAEDEKSFRILRTKEELLRIIDSGALNRVYFHNGLGYDLNLLRSCWGIPFTVGANGEDTWNGQPVRFVDTLHLSQYNNPDRLGGHSVDNLSAVINGVSRKVANEDWSQFTPLMLERCKVDCIEGEKIANYLLREAEELYRDV
jgi:hypothetical protein